VAAERALVRIPDSRVIRYTAIVLKDGRLRFLELTGRLVNISANGLCFLTRYPLERGHVIEFRKKMLQCTHGVVMWIKRAGSAYLAGARLMKKARR
jgi:hypothetical protein